MCRLLVLPLLLFAVACSDVNTDNIGGAVQDTVQSGGEAKQTSCCNGLATIAEVRAAGEANPHRAMLKYDTKTMRGCLEGQIVAFPKSTDTIRDQRALDDPSRISIDVKVNEERGFTLRRPRPDEPEVPAILDEPDPHDLTEAQQADWWEKRDKAMEEYNKALDEALAQIPEYTAQWEAFILSKSVGDTLRAECDLFNTRRAEQYDPLGEGTSRHRNCERIE